MHDLCATKHISQMVLPDAFLGSIESNFFHNILGKIKIPKILGKNLTLYCPKSVWQKPFEKICLVAYRSCIFCFDCTFGQLLKNSYFGEYGGVHNSKIVDY